MNRKDALKIRAGRALDIIKRRADDDDWEKVVDQLEEFALVLAKRTGDTTWPALRTYNTTMYGPEDK